jgi:pyruvate carboxylase subunit B
MSEYIISLNGKKIRLSLLSESKVLFDGEELDYEIIESVNNVYFLRIGKKIYNFTCVHKKDEKIVLFSCSKKYDLTVRTSLQEKANEVLAKKQTLHHFVEVKAPMPGMLLKVKKIKGDYVEVGEAVMILEAMKMENEIRSSTRGTVKNIFVKEGEAVEKGTILFSVEN